MSEKRSARGKSAAKDSGRMAALFRSPIAVAVAAALYPASVTLAQGSRSADGLEEVVVTATRREVKLQEVPQSVTALSTEFIEQQSLNNMADLAGALPSLNIVTPWPGQNNIIIRGITTGTGQYRIDSQVSVYLDEQPMTSISQQVDVRLIDIERVELLPGPQGTLFGSSAQAGTLAYVTNKPKTDGFAAEVAGELGNTQGGSESYDLSAWANLPVSDNFAVRAVGFLSKEGGFVDNVLGPTLFGNATNADIARNNQNSYEQSGGRVAGLWTINPQWSALLTGIYQRSKTEGHWDTDPFLGDNKITRFFDDWRDDKWYTASGTLRGDLGFAELSLTASHLDRKVDYEFDNTNYAHWRTAGTGAYYALYDTGTLASITFNTQEQKRWAYEARLTSSGQSKLRWMAGAFFEDVEDWWNYGASMIGGDLTKTAAWAEANRLACRLRPPVAKCPLAPTQIYYLNEYENKVQQLAFFGEVTYSLTDKWDVTGGARWFKFDREQFDKYNVPLGLPASSDPDANGLTNEGSDSDTSLKFATTYKFNPEVMVYALYSEGFRLGGQNSARAAATGEVPLVYGPDQLSNFEVGIKSDWFDNRLRLNLSLFLMRWDDIQVRFTSTSSRNGGAFWIEGNINGGEAEQKGAEFAGAWKATPQLKFEWSAFLASPEFTEDTFELNSTDVFIAKGTMLPVSPKEKLWVSTEYMFSKFLPWSGDVWTRFSYSWQGKTWDSLSAIEDDDREFLLPEYKSGTLQFGFTSENDWDASLIVRNLFDDRGVNWQSSTDRGALFGDPRFRYVRGLQRPRSVYLSFTKKW
ncbi:MAG: TonB-dependent receptor [Gammaproteobacteria bacterium]|nr:TonB-dependent receptor [Gammaproteobacteria bacterium]